MLWGWHKLKQKELLIISHLQTDERENLTKISKSTGIPVSTLFDKLKKYEGDIIRRHTSLLNFGKIGYDVHVQLMLKTKGSKDALEKFLMNSIYVNSCYKVNNGFDFMVELIFRNMNDYYGFSEKLDEYFVQKKNEFFVLKELKREAFLNDSNLVGLF